MTEQNLKYVKYGIAGIAIVGIIWYATRPAEGGGEDDPTQGAPDSPSFNASKVKNDLLEAMSSTGTDEEAILSILKFVSPAQFELVFKAFGKQQYNKTLGNQINPIGWFTQLPFEPLNVWLKNELSASEYNVLKTKYPKNL